MFYYHHHRRHSLQLQQQQQRVRREANPEPDPRGGSTDVKWTGQALKKRDFQEVHPPKNQKEFYNRYDPWVGTGTGLLFGAFLLLIFAHVMIKYFAKKTKKWRRRKIKRLKTKPFYRRIFGGSSPPTPHHSYHHSKYPPLCETSMANEQTSNEAAPLELNNIAVAANRKTSSSHQQRRKGSSHSSGAGDEYSSCLDLPITILPVVCESAADNNYDFTDNTDVVRGNNNNNRTFTLLAPLNDDDDSMPHIQLIQPTPCVTPSSSDRRLHLIPPDCECDIARRFTCSRCRNTLQIPQYPGIALNNRLAMVEVHPHSAVFDSESNLLPVPYNQHPAAYRVVSCSAEPPNRRKLNLLRHSASLDSGLILAHLSTPAQAAAATAYYIRRASSSESDDPLCRRPSVHRSYSDDFYSSQDSVFETPPPTTIS